MGTTHALLLPGTDGRLAPYTPGAPAIYPAVADPPQHRVAFAAAHVVCDPLADTDPTGAADLDWDVTLAYRRHLWALSLSVAEAMDTAQRGMAPAARCQGG